MKILKAILLTIGIVTLSSSVFGADLGGFTIESFHVDMNIKADGSMDVKETINVNFSVSRHGIFREIPTKDPAGDYVHIKNITTIGDPVAGLTLENGYYILKIGSADSYVFGPKIYTITYTVQNAIKAYASGSNTTSGGRQELYRNVIGPEWNTTIANSSFSIRLPKDQIFQSGSMFVVRGGNGEQNKNGATIIQTNGTTLDGNVSVTLAANQGVTVGLQFPSDYFVADKNYNDLFTQKPSLGFWNLAKTFIQQILRSIGEGIIQFLFFIVFISTGILGSKSRGSIQGRKSARKSSKAITPYYLPPRNIEPAHAFRFWYNAQNPQIFVALLYYWATKGRTRIELVEGKKYFFGIKGEDTFVIHETQENPPNATETDKELLQEFFGPRDSVQDKVQLTKESYGKMTRVLGDLQAVLDGQIGKRYEKKGNIFTRKYVLTGEGEQLFEEMRGFKAFLEKVERPVIDSELKNNPNYLNTILPWAVLFGVETRLLKLCEDMLQQMDWYQSYNGSALNAYTFAAMTSNIKSSVIAPRSSGGGSSSSGFGGGSGGGFSGGGGGGGGGGSR